MGLSQNRGFDTRFIALLKDDDKASLLVGETHVATTRLMTSPNLFGVCSELFQLLSHICWSPSHYFSLLRKQVLLYHLSKFPQPQPLRSKPALVMSQGDNMSKRPRRRGGKALTRLNFNKILEFIGVLTNKHGG